MQSEDRDRRIARLQEELCAYREREGQSSPDHADPRILSKVTLLQISQERVQGTLALQNRVAADMEKRLDKIDRQIEGNGKPGIIDRLVGLEKFQSLCVKEQQARTWLWRTLIGGIITLVLAHLWGIFLAKPSAPAPSTEPAHVAQ